MFSETFGRDFEDLINLLVEHSNPLPGSPTVSAPTNEFVRLFIAGAAFFVFHTIEACRYKNIMEFVLSAMSSIPELRPCKHKLLDPAIHAEFSAMSLDGLAIKYAHIRRALALTRFPTDQQMHPKPFCQAKITETIIQMSYLLGGLALEGSLLPQRTGILRIYDAIREPFDIDYVNEHGGSSLRTTLESHDYDDSLIFPFFRYISIFSGELPQHPMGGSLSAISDGRVYCFIDTVQGLSDCFEKASMIHVGAGSIQVRNQLHEGVYDQHQPSEPHRTVYQAQRVQRVEKDLCPFSEDSTSSDLSTKAAVQESVRLSFWYEIPSKLGTTLISPASFVQIQLKTAIAFKTESYPKISTPDHSEETVNRDPYFSVIYGEGLAPKDYSTRIILRPHRGNVLGRCIALKTSSTPVALLSKESDLSQFMDFWDHKTKTSSQPALMRYTLIS